MKIVKDKIIYYFISVYRKTNNFIIFKTTKTFWGKGTISVNSE